MFGETNPLSDLIPIMQFTNFTVNGVASLGNPYLSLHPNYSVATYLILFFISALI